MNEKAINSLNKTLTIHFPIDELGVYMHGSDLDDKAVPVLAKSLSILGLTLPKAPTKIVFRSRWSVPGYAPDDYESFINKKEQSKRSIQ